MFDDVLIESAGKDKKKGGWITAVISAIIHLGVVGAIVAAGYYVKENPEVIEKPINAFIVASAPPPPPPPPPPAASHASSTPTRPKVETPREETPRETFRQPTEVPDEIPEVDESAGRDDEDADAGVEGGVVGGVKGGVVGGVVGGTVGGVIGGQLGGQVGGQIGGQPDAPVRVGGNVKAPTIKRRVDPMYTDIARRARLQGFVIIEAVIDRQGNVTDARIIKGLGMGLDETALNALRQWKFSPGTLNGQPVPVYYNLTINFQLNS
ncbi:MAG TPA: energy transducer TonB [Thermoanaerobaculia bacterium]|jgi:protein TonB